MDLEAGEGGGPCCARGGNCASPLGSDGMAGRFFGDAADDEPPGQRLPGSAPGPTGLPAGGTEPKPEGQLTLEEKKFLLAVERGDLATARRYLQSAEAGLSTLNCNCTDPLGRSALLMAIDNENLEMIELLLLHNVDTRDALLHAISEEYVEAVELLLEREEATRKPGQPNDSLRHSRSRIDSYRALASPSLIALSSKDPILTAFELSGELRRLAYLEHEFKSEYLSIKTSRKVASLPNRRNSIRKNKNSGKRLDIDQHVARYSVQELTGELAILHVFTTTIRELLQHGDRMHLTRLKMAIRFKQKKFCAHPNVQQLLASIWYEGLPGFRRKNIILQSMQILKIGLLFPVYSVAYIVAPHSNFGRTLRKPFIKFICHSASYVTFLFLLMLASQRIETVVVEWFGTDEMKQKVRSDITTKRGASPSIVEWIILAWVIEYVGDMWNIIDFITNSLYVATVALRVIAYLQVQKEIAQNTGTAYLPREKWDAWDPILIAEGLFATANIFRHDYYFSSLKLVYIFSVNPHLGPLQISLGRMVIDIVKFFFVYTLVLFAFACGMNQLLWYYADSERQLCHKLNRDGAPVKSDHSVCFTWRRFANLFESSQTLFWASFGLIDLDNFELSGIQSYTRFWGLLMFGSYCVINVVVLLNLLIAMMNHSYQMISEHADVEWKFARCKLWMSNFEDGGTVPPPFNVIPTPKTVSYFLRWCYRKLCGNSRSAKKEHLKTIRRKARQASERDMKYQTIMRNLVRRYITSEQRKADNQGVTEDDVNEIKQEISSFRYELLEVLKIGGFNTSGASGQSQGIGGKKGRQRERRLMKGFNIGLIEGSVPSPPEINIEEVTSRKSPVSRLARLARLASKNKVKRGRWGHLVEATRSARAAFSRSRSEETMSSSSSGSSVGPKGGDSVCNSETSLSMRGRISRKFGTLTFSRSRLAFFSEHDSLRHSSSEKRRAHRTVSAPPSSVLPRAAMQADRQVAADGASGGGSSNVLAAECKLSPIPSCASSKVPTPRNSINGTLEPDGACIAGGAGDYVAAAALAMAATADDLPPPPPPPTEPCDLPMVVVQPSSEHEDALKDSDESPANGSIPLLTRVYGIEPVGKPANMGWI
ncbi:hypothetical protein HPB52_015283 [Rhipicephalus sanguineus]|uniref:Transient receptor ion channel domain-containing protein n=1 Tax=Rhipicephalus sanguineus TaxID=34632 RepID=A0A9D4Q7G0_RHISA|nr:hypothetical protein HPB52_015283 [Rhipicephalus sanguineus]